MFGTCCSIRTRPAPHADARSAYAECGRLDKTASSVCSGARNGTINRAMSAVTIDQYSLKRPRRLVDHRGDGFESRARAT